MLFIEMPVRLRVDELADVLASSMEYEELQQLIFAIDFAVADLDFTMDLRDALDKTIHEELRDEDEVDG